MILVDLKIPVTAKTHIRKNIASINILPSSKLWRNNIHLVIPKNGCKNIVIQEGKTKVAYLFDDLSVEQMNRFKNSNTDTLDSQFEKKYLGRVSYNLSDEIGIAEEEFPKLPKYYYNKDGKLKKFTYINMIQSKVRKKSIGTKLICNAIQDGVAHGSQGRVLLEAVDLQKGEGSPIKFYKKLGFRFCDEAFDKKIDEMIAKNQNLDDIDFDYKTGMYLPSEKVADLLMLNRSFDVMI